MTAATLLSVAAVMAEHADHATGRHVAVTRATIADRVGCDVRTVTAAWRVLRASQWAVEAQRGHGSTNTPSVGRRPSVYHLVPRREARPVTRPVVHDFHLPPSGGVSSSSPVRSYSPSERASAPAHRIPDKQRQTRLWRSTARPLAIQRLAAGLVAITHGLDRAHIGTICDALTAAGIDPTCGQPARSTTSSTPTCAPEERPGPTTSPTLARSCTADYDGCPGHPSRPRQRPAAPRPSASIRRRDRQCSPRRRKHGSLRPKKRSAACSPTALNAPAAGTPAARPTHGQRHRDGMPLEARHNGARSAPLVAWSTTCLVVAKRCADIRAKRQKFSVSKHLIFVVSCSPFCTASASFTRAPPAIFTHSTHSQPPLPTPAQGVPHPAILQNQKLRMAHLHKFVRCWWCGSV